MTSIRLVSQKTLFSIASSVYLCSSVNLAISPVVSWAIAGAIKNNSIAAESTAVPATNNGLFIFFIPSSIHILISSFHGLYTNGESSFRLISISKENTVFYSCDFDYAIINLPPHVAS